MNFGPSIVTDNLIFAVDVANPDSYISGSTIWNDQTVNQNNSTLTNGPTFDSNNGGSIDFDGIDDYVSMGNALDFISKRLHLEYFLIEEGYSDLEYILGW